LLGSTAELPTKNAVGDRKNRLITEERATGGHTRLSVLP